MHEIYVPKDILSRVAETLEKYRLGRPKAEVLVAFSGGKDSTFTASVLSALGFQVKLLAIDMGYAAGWAERLRGMASAMSFPFDVLTVRESRFQEELDSVSQAAVRQKLTILNAMSTINANSPSPCTQCYNTKITAIAHYMRKLGYEWIAFGHHATDAVASFLKSALMYIDRWEKGSESWDRHRFGELVEEFYGQLTSRGTDRFLLSRMIDLVNKGFASTDEPPAQPLHRETPNLQIMRPLFEIFEHDIIEITNSWSLGFESSGCGHGSAQENETPREMIHYRILRPLSISEDGRNWLRLFFEILRAGIEINGRLKINARNSREQLLGPIYRSGMGADLKL
jgi:tRNA(Ile)-lysidine synthase TilS/MesJ